MSSATVSRVSTGAALLALWEIVARVLAPSYVAKPSTVALALPRGLVDPRLLEATAITLGAVAEGLAIALVIGTALGLVMGRSVVAERALRHYVNGFYAVPMIVVLPLLSLWFGYTGATRLAVIVFAAVFSIIVNVADGARAVSREYLEVASAFRSPGARMLIDVVLPSATPYVFAGLRLAAGRALIGAVVAEFFTAIGGLGYYILYHSRTFRHADAFVGVLLLAGFGVGFELLVDWATRRCLPWYRRDDVVQ